MAKSPDADAVKLMSKTSVKCRKFDIQNDISNIFQGDKNVKLELILIRWFTFTNVTPPSDISDP